MDNEKAKQIKGIIAEAASGEPTEEAADAKVQGTPTVMLDGEQFTDFRTIDDMVEFWRSLAGGGLGPGLLLLVRPGLEVDDRVLGAGLIAALGGEHHVGATEPDEVDLSLANRGLDQRVRLDAQWELAKRKAVPELIAAAGEPE